MSKVTFKGPSLNGAIEDIIADIQKDMEARTWKAALELRNSAMLVLRGQRSGRRYKVPGTFRRQTDKSTGKKRNGRYYTASAPGEPPAVRTGTFRNSWQAGSSYSFGTKTGRGTYIARIESDVMTDDGKHNLGEILEYGTSRMAPRPHHDRILDHAEKRIYRIYEQDYE